MTYTGAPTTTLRRTVDKARAKQILQKNNVPTAPFQVFSRADEDIHAPLPAIVKPVAEDASLGITRESVVFDEVQLRKRVQYILDVYHQPALVEEDIVGREFNVGLWGNGTTHLLPLAELSFAQWDNPYQQFCHFDAKWTPDSLEYQTMPVICPAQIDEVTAERIRAVAYRSYQALGCRDYARVDLRVRDGGDWVVYVAPPQVIEIMTDQDERLTIPIPMSLFLGWDRRYYLWALEGKVFNPTLTVFKAPYPNVYENGRISWGSHRVPKVTTSNIQNTWKLFFSTVFNNHIAGNKTKNHPASALDLLRRLSAANKKSFPRDELLWAARSVDACLENIFNYGGE